MGMKNSLGWLAVPLVLACSGSEFSSLNTRLAAKAGAGGTDANGGEAGELVTAGRGGASPGVGGSGSTGGTADLGGSGGGQDRVCVPGTTQECLGPSRCAGAQSCAKDGAGWGACECTFGTGGDGGTSAGTNGASGTQPIGTAGEGGANVVGGGEPCDGISTVCAPGLFCDPASSRCIAPLGGDGGTPVVVGPGEKCDGVEFVCEDGFYCKGDDTTGRNCATQRTTGQSCDSNEECMSGRCEGGSPSTKGTCS